MRIPFVESLEQRQLLTFIAFGREHMVAGTTGAVGADMAVADDGSFWVESLVGTSPNQTLMATRYSAHAELIGKPIRVNSLNETPEFGPIATDSNGDAVIAYANGPGINGVFFRRISNDGIVSRPVAVTNSRNVTSGASVSMDAGGGFFIGWVEEQGPNTTAYVRSFDAAGAPRTQPIVVKQTETVITDIRSISVVAKANGSATAYMMLETSDTDGGVIGLASASNVTVGGFLSSTKQADFERNANGSSVAGFTQSDENVPGDDAGMVSRFDSTGTIIGSPVRLGDPDAHSSNVSVAGFPDGGFITTYAQGTLGSRTFFLARYRSDGTLDAAPVALGSSNKITPLIGTAADGTTVLAWVASDNTVHFRRFTPDFAALDGSELYVLGSKYSDSLSVKSVASTVVVRSNVKGRERQFDLAAVNALTINAFEGGDVINDTLSVPATIQGGTGSDDISVKDTTASVLVSGQDGYDSIRIGDNVAATVYGGNGDDGIVGGAGDQYFDGQGGNDRIYGGDGNDHLLGGAHDDHLDGGGGNDTLDGGAGKDWLEGGAGNDVIFAVDNEHDRLVGGDGDDSAKRDKNLDAVDGIESLA